MSKNDGGPAFPTAFPAVHVPMSGMSLRDWFAGQALHCVEMLDPGCGKKHRNADAIARDCYDIADAMLKERDK